MVAVRKKDIQISSVALTEQKFLFFKNALFFTVFKLTSAVKSIWINVCVLSGKRMHGAFEF